MTSATQIIRRKDILPSDDTTPAFGTTDYDVWEQQHLAQLARRSSDRYIYERWCQAGRWLLAADTPALHHAFATTFASVMAGFEGAPAEAKLPRIENWCEAGARLVAAGP